MKKKLLNYLMLGFSLISLPATGQNQNKQNISETTLKKEKVPEKVYKEEWPSIARHKTPEWFRDAKFGIYTHFGPAVLATQHKTTEWWGWAMYNTKAKYWTNAIRPDSPDTTRNFKLHRELFGDQNEYGYKDLIMDFQPDKFDAEEWAEIFSKSGAKFSGPMGCHHDNFMLWDSEVTRWNMKRTAGIDVVGELEKAIRARDMKFVMTFHHAFSWWFFSESYKFDGANPEYEDLYCRPHKFSTDPDSFEEYPDAEYEDLWFRKLKEAYTKYNPDLLWFDMGLELLSDEIRQRAFAGMLNNAANNNQEIGISYKTKFDICIPPSAGILDYEKGRSTGLREDVWLTDTPLGGWFYNGRKSRSAEAMIEILVDIVSKNGCLLLDVSPKPDGTIPEDQIKTLLGMGEWLKMNGEAIYNTRPWVIAEEGPTKLAKDGHFNENWEAIYTEEDIRFTRSKDNKTLYITVLDRPSQGKVLVKKLATVYEYLDRDIDQVNLLGTEGNIKWNRNKKGLELQFPKNANGKYAFCYKLQLK
ncbi:alpha-L-fucosidase [Saccharicrinis fermentans]|uniref:alpha-L-fucosidase n=1 Tax=Saccharicrinis fermentans DSM 9555 = JCM 21142 TaxID=869213 RepID=W7YM35_9BACT|nr:alpha-L-fucosidase [Saccharicrinis fermentans]GAF05716.1 alpha-L-fucosidase [Saccharicrinis fermentans DSM 9555 = JCM 21142]